MWIAKGLVVFLAFFATHCFAFSIEGVDIDAGVFTKEMSDRSTQRWDEIIDALALPIELQRADWRSLTGPRANNNCIMCKLVAKKILSMRQNGLDAEKIQEEMGTLCTRFNVQTEHVCHGLVKLNAPTVMHILDADPSITPDDICGMALQNTTCATPSDKHKWSIEIDTTPPKKIDTVVTTSTVNIVQITDIHYDPLYEPMGNSQCDEPTCCRKGQNSTNFGNKVAGYWGDYNYCDAPWHAVVDALEHIRNQHQDITYIYFTGDIIDHGVWETTKKGNTESLVKMYNKFNEIFENIPVYPIVGNHEPHPLNLFASDNIKDENLSSVWLYELLADLWISYGWLPESTRETILRGGFYTFAPRKGFRVVSLNNNVCYTYNWWLLLEPRDPNGQLRWLADTLSKAEKTGEFVHILTHIPTGTKDCHFTWSREYHKIVNRYAHIISGQFNGHTHNDEFNVFYDIDEPLKPINLAWNGGSITTYANLNPNYKVYKANKNTLDIVDVDTWMYNLTLANETPEKRPVWYKSYSFVEEYGLENLSLVAIHDWIVGVSRDISLLEPYYKNFHKYADPALKSGCDEVCLKKYLCRIVTTNAEDSNQCDDFLELL